MRKRKMAMRVRGAIRPWSGGMRVALLAFTVGGPGAAYAQSYECLIEPNIEISLSSATAGVVDRVDVERGDAVRKGQVLVRLESGVERAAFDLARARADFAERKLQRNEDLVAEQLISSNERDELETERDLAKLEMREAQAVLAQRTIRSPVDAVVVDVATAPGEYVRDTELMRLARIDPLNVEVVVPVALHGRIEEGALAVVRPEPPFDAPREAKVVIVDPVVDAASGTFGIRLELPNPDRRLPAGLKCTVELRDAAPPKPASADAGATLPPAADATRVAR